MRTQLPDHLIEWDDYFGGWIDISSIPNITTAPEQIEIIHPEDTKRNVIATMYNEVKNTKGEVEKWLYDFTMGNTTYMFTLFNQ